MKYRNLGKTGYNVSEVSLGTWQLGSKWGETFDLENALATLAVAVQNGVNLFDTADIYQDGMSEQAIGEFLKTQKERIFVVTKCGRALNPHIAEGYNAENITRFAVESLGRLKMPALDLLLLHCPPTVVYHSPEAFEALENLRGQGIIRHYGVSVETVDEAIAALDYDISAIEIIFNMFRLKPAIKLFQKAAEKNVGIIARVPLASGLLTGKFDENSIFGKNDHRNYNKNGDFFDKGETFSGIDYLVGVKAARELKKALNTENLAAMALRYILMYPEISTVIPGASSPKQIVNNTLAAQLPDFTSEQMEIVRDIYNRYIREMVEDKW